MLHCYTFVLCAFKYLKPELKFTIKPYICKPLIILLFARGLYSLIFNVSHIFLSVVVSSFLTIWRQVSFLLLTFYNFYVTNDSNFQNLLSA